jgi:hypothetical protein
MATEQSYATLVSKSVASATGLAESAYKTARSYTPKFAEPLVASVEDRAATVSAPYLTYVADAGAKVLHNADELVRRRELAGPGSRAGAGERRGGGVPSCQLPRGCGSWLRRGSLATDLGIAS